MRNSLAFFGITLILLLFLSSCNYTKNLAKNEYALVRNTVKVEEVRDPQFDNLIDLVRPIPNRNFMGIFPIKVSLWANHQPRIDSITGKTRDSKFNQWLRRLGEPPVLMDSIDMQRSISQINLAMSKRGYFDATSRAEVQFLRKQKSRVNYIVTPNQPYYIRSVDYQVDIPEYKRIVITDAVNSLVKKGAIYNEEELVAERARIVSKIRDQGFFYANANLVTFLVDTNNAFAHLNIQNHPTVAITIKVSYDDVNDETLIAKFKNRYKFNNVLIYTNYDLNFDRSINLDTIPYLDFRNRSDSTLYEFVTLKRLRKGGSRIRLIKDFNSRTIANAIWMKRGDLFTQTAFDRTHKKLRDLNNFTIINIAYYEDEALWDSINKIGALNTVIRLTRAQQHGVEGAFDIRTDRTGLSLAYTNRNTFRGAEFLRVSGYGNFYYYSWLNSVIKKEAVEENAIYGELGGEILLRFPRLLMLPKYQNINFWGYSTEIRFSASYVQLFSRLNLQIAYTYNWNPTRYLAHSISPVDVATLDTRNTRNVDLFAKYPESYQRKFEKFFLPSARYNLVYWTPEKNGNIFRVNFFYETVGLLLYGINSVVDKDRIWTIFNDFNYGIYQKFDLNLAYTTNINRNNSFATRFVFGMAIPLRKETVIPFERSFFVGGASSMRGWTFRQLGPGGFYSEDYIERVGDMRVELNLEYRGTIYKAFKYGVFSDIGNVWLLSKYEDMPNAEFNFNTFYKQIAFCVGLGLRLDFNFFVIRLDYGLPIYDPSKPEGNYWINKNWAANKWWNGAQGIQFGINYAF
ncbi:MAG: outer membrane protein assembly factor [Bacteroidetes bacterium]|nr:outer membrane protein assembly factor [Bacteroidota bacterium]MCL2301786.1 outer membrane protein assembly factor [Lentimicrobiaceae bacterium]